LSAMAWHWQRWGADDEDGLLAPPGLVGSDPVAGAFGSTGCAWRADAGGGRGGGRALVSPGGMMMGPGHRRQRPREGAISTAMATAAPTPTRPVRRRPSPEAEAEPGGGCPGSDPYPTQGLPAAQGLLASGPEPADQASAAGARWACSRDVALGPLTLGGAGVSPRGGASFGSVIVGHGLPPGAWQEVRLERTSRCAYSYE